MKIDKEAQEYYAQLTAFYQQFRRIGNNYNQCVKTIHTIYGEKKSLAFLYKLAEETRKLEEVCKQVIELTKRYEEKTLTTFSEILQYYKDNEPRGEYVLVIAGKTFEELKQEEQKNWENLSLEEHMEVYEKQGIGRKEAMKLVAKDRGISKRDVYQALLS